MKVRLISSAVGILICIVLMIFGEINSVVINVAVSLLNMLLCGELLSAKSLHKQLKLSVPCLVFAFFMPLLSYTGASFIPLYLFSLVVFTMMVVFHDKITMNDAVFAYAGTMLVTLSMTSLVVVSCSDNKFTSFWAILCLGVPWLSDSGAYFSGYFLGKRKLCPTISPHKTVEGAIGGLISGFFGSLLIGLAFLLIYSDVSINFIALAIIGIVNPVISIIGDLTFSIIKRECNIKDYGSIMPGHGGGLDRFDSVIFCAPFVFLVSQYITVIQ